MGTKHQGTAAEVRALDAYIKLLRASDSVSGRALRSLEGTGLTDSQFGALEALHHLGPLCQKVLGEKILKSPGNVTMVVRNLEKRRLVKRTRHPANRRYVTVSLTPAGRRVVQGVFPRHVRAVVAQMRALSPREQRALGRLCRKVGRARG